MTQTKWINVNGNLYECTIETVQYFDGQENTMQGIATLQINGIKVRAIVELWMLYDSPEAYYQKQLSRAQSYKESTQEELGKAVVYRKMEVDRMDAEVKMWQSKLDLLKHES